MKPIRVWLVFFFVLMAGHAWVACGVTSPPSDPLTPRPPQPAADQKVGAVLRTSSLAT